MSRALRVTSAVLAVAAAVAAVWLIVTAKDTKHAQIGALLGFWSLLMAAFPALGSRGARPGGPVLTGTELDLRPAGVLERREDAQQRTAYERELMQLVRTEISSTLGPELANLRADVAALRGEILETVGGQIRLERIETTRMIGSDLEALQHELRQLRGDAAPMVDRPEPRGLANRLWEQPAQAPVAPPPAAPAASAPYATAPAAAVQPPTAPPPATVPPQGAMQPTVVPATEPSPEWSDWTVPAPIIEPVAESTAEPVAESSVEPSVASPGELRIAAEVEAEMASSCSSDAARQPAEQAAADRGAVGMDEENEDEEDDDDPFALLPRIPPYLNPEPGPHYPREEYSGGRRAETGGRSSGGRHSGGDGQWAAESTQRGGRRRRSDASEDVLARILEREAPQY
jgi:hypothetical protein